jgi:cardiolipin synthase
MDTWVFALAAAAIQLLGGVCALHALLHKTRHTTSAIAWILTCLLVPLLGALLYVTVGQDHLARRRSTDVSRSRTLFRDRKPGAHLFPPESIGEEAFVRRIGLATLSDNPLVGGNAVDFRIDGEAAYSLMLEAIKTARETITWSYYIFDGDGEGRKFRDALIERAGAGVNVRVLYDAVGSQATHDAFWKSLLDGGIKVRAFLRICATGEISFLMISWSVCVVRWWITCSGSSPATGSSLVGRISMTNRSSGTPTSRETPWSRFWKADLTRFWMSISA